ncbi:MAG: hypothetical protein HYX90_10920 [Chloroflexi bacterium]|nr:hypothetical protein [Chloroflexota bacterium]
MSFKRHLLTGIIAGILLLAVYAGLLTLGQGWQHLLGQTSQQWYWIAALVLGFGTQAGLFSFIRQSMKARRASANASLATSGGVSSGSMVACCAHHVSDVLPLVGLAGLAAFVVKFQPFFIVLGVLSNAFGIAVMLNTIQRHQLCNWVARWRVNMASVSKGVAFAAAVILVIVGLRVLTVP